jgi:hypothetical protein
VRRGKPGEHESQAGYDERNHKDAQPVPRKASEELPEIDIDICGRGLNGHAFLLQY